MKVIRSDVKAGLHQRFSPAAEPIFAEWFLLQGLGLPLPWQQHVRLRLGLDCVDFCTTLYDRDEKNVLKHSHQSFFFIISFFTVRVTVTSMLELHLGNAFLAVHLDLLAQLLLVLTLDNGMLSI